MWKARLRPHQCELLHKYCAIFHKLGTFIIPKHHRMRCGHEQSMLLTNHNLILDVCEFSGVNKDPCRLCPSATTSCPGELRGPTFDLYLKAFILIYEPFHCLTLSQDFERRDGIASPRRRRTLKAAWDPEAVTRGRRGQRKRRMKN